MGVVTKKLILFKVVISWILMSKLADAFTMLKTKPSVLYQKSIIEMSARSENNKVTRREWIEKSATGCLLGIASIGTFDMNQAYASVFVDPDRYGDKELKVATVNKLRQTIRNAILQSPDLAPFFLKIAIQDALTYDSSNQSGGPDGTIVSTILADKEASTALIPLKPAAAKLVQIFKDMKKTNEITMADVVSFAGAEAIESAGGPRVSVQLGKLDPKQEPSLSSSNFPDLSNTANGEAIVNAFQKSGLTEREVALLFGAIGSIEAVVGNVQPEEEIEQEENEMGDKDIFIPSSFGGPSQIYGKQLGKMDNSIFATIKADLKSRKRPFASVFTNEKVSEWAVTYYADKKKAFFSDLPQAYERLMGLGSRYTGGKVGSLLGGSDDNV